MRFKAPVVSFNENLSSHWLGHAATARQRLASLAVCVAALAVLAWQAGDGYLRQQALAAGQARLQSAQAVAVQGAARIGPDPATLDPHEIARRHAAASQLNIPWSDLFDGLERSAQPDVGLTVLEPDAQKGTIHLQAEAKDIGRLIAYAQAIAAEPAFTQLSLQQHETNELEPTRPARLTFEVRLRDPSRPAGAPR